MTTPKRGRKPQDASKKEATAGRPRQEKEGPAKKSAAAKKGAAPAKSGTARSSGARTRQQNIALVVVALFAMLLFGAIAYSQSATAGSGTLGKTTGGATNGAAGGAAVPSADGWIWNDPDGALARAKAEDKPILIDFWASWCVWCKKMDDETYPDARVKKALSGYVLLKIDVDRLPDLQKQFQADGLPTTVIVDKSGKEIRRTVGYQTADQFVPFLSSGGA
jgi:thiol:disulfide interchange protein DsbD